MKEKITNIIKKYNTQYKNDEMELDTALDLIYDEIYKVSKGKAFVITELDEQSNSIYPTVLFQALQKLNNKHIKEIISEQIDSINLYIAITE